MKLPVLMMIWNLLIVIMITGSASESTEDYARLISDVFKFSKYSAVSLMHFTNEENFSQRNVIFNLQELLSKEKIMTSTINLEKVFSLTEIKFLKFKELGRFTRTMIVFFLRSERDFTKMRASSEFLNKNRIINLILFAQTDTNPLPEYCINLNDNPFLLSEGISLLVKCWEDTTIREWHSLNENQMKVYERATWEPATGLILKSENLILNELDVLNGKVLLSATIAETEFVGDYFENLCRALELAGNFTIKKVKVVKNYGELDKNTKSWTGGVGLIVNQDVDLVTGFYSLSPEQYSYIDYSEYIRLKPILVIRQPRSLELLSWTAYFDPFTVGLWITLLLSLIVIQTICIFMKLMLQKDVGKKKLVVEDFFCIWEIYCQQGIAEFPQAASLRIFYCSVFLFAFTVLSIYSASFVSKLTITDSNLPFKSLQEFSVAKTHKLLITDETTVKDKFKNAIHSPWKEAGNLLLKKDMPYTHDYAVKMICKGKVALFSYDFFFPIAYNTTKNICPMVKINTDEYESFGIILRKNSPYTRAINYILMKLRADGVMQRIISTFYRIIQPPVDEPDNIYHAANVLDVAVLFAILFGSIVFSVIILFCENLYFWFSGTRILYEK